MKRYGLIGYPLTHSFSRKFFLDKFEKESIKNVTYSNFPIQSIKEFPELLLKNKDLKGINVTSPYKVDVIQYLDEIDDDAKAIGAVNVVKVSMNNDIPFLKGFNTDVYGFSAALNDINTEGVKSALILGTGGAADAVAFSLKKMNIEYSFISRKKSADKLVLAYDDTDKNLIKKNLLIINATPAGLFPLINEKPPIPYEYIGENHILYDLIYNPKETLFLKEGIKRGALTLNGLKMLHFQAEKAWEIFNS